MKDTQETNLPLEENGKLEDAKAPDVMPEERAEAIAPSESAVEEKPEEEPEAETVGQMEQVEQVEQKTEEPESAQETIEEPVQEAPEEVAAEAPAEEAAEDTPAEEPPSAPKLTKETILEKLTDLVNRPVETARNDVDSLKQAFYRLHRLEAEDAKKAFIEGGGEEDAFEVPEDEDEKKLKELLSIYKDKRAAFLAQEEQTKAANYALKLQLIDRMKELTESQDDFNKLYQEFKDIQQRWKETKLVPQEHANELWKNYQLYSEKFYDIIKINNQFRDYDFKKNLELKTALCEAVEKLETEPDVISAFHQLQKLHQQWREIGPVSKELREEIWQRFKASSTIINKRHQQHFESLKGKEQENLEAKTAICEEIEKIDFTLLKSFRDWEEKNKEVMALQNKWKSIGFAPKKFNVKIFERFRAACDVYFQKKAEYYKVVKGEMEKNLDLKKALCEKAEALKDNTDWKETTDKMIALQKEWKTIGSIPRKHSDAVWKRFITACDYFFEQKNKNFVSQKSVEQTNLAAKKELIEKISALDESLGTEEAVALLKDYMAEWNAIGYVPFKEKDSIYKKYYEAIDNQFDRLKIDKDDRRMQAFRSSISDMASGERGKGKLFGERDKLMRTFERLKSELQTYENNIGFLNISSKGGGGLVKEMERKIERLKEEMALIVKKIDAIDENLE